jgi:hypothetical protein
VHDTVLLDAVCQSNLSKFREGWTKDAAGKVIKSPLYDKLDIERVIEVSNYHSAKGI